MKRVQKFVVIAFRLIKGRLLIAEMREARGERRAQSAWQR